MPTITSLHNPFIKHVHKLGESTRYRRECGETLLDGVHLVDACLNANRQPIRVLVADSYMDKPEIEKLLQRLDCPVDRANEQVFAKVSELKTLTGIVGVYAIPAPAAGKTEFSIWMDEIQDPGNVGSILRTAAAAGADAVYLSGGCADAWSPRVLRAAMGAHFDLDIYPQTDLLELAARHDGLLLTTVLQRSQPLYRADWGKEKRAWVFGNEGTGVSPELLDYATHRIHIPMPGAVESLNVAAAAAVCLFEDVRRRQE